MLDSSVAQGPDALFFRDLLQPTGTGAEYSSMKRIITIASLMALSMTAVAGNTQASVSSAYTNAVNANDTETSLLAEGELTTDDGEIVIYSVYLLDGSHLLGSVSVHDTSHGTNLMYSIDGDTVIVRGSREGERVNEVASISEFVEIDWSSDPPTVRRKWKCPGWIGKVICTVGATIIEACAQEGEFLGVKCGDSVDGGTTGGGGGGGDGGGDTDTDTDTD